MTYSVPTISLVTPSYNQARYLDATIRSILAQGYPGLEYVICDGGSADESVAIIRRHEGRLKFWRSGKDGGQAQAINEGFGHCTGEWIGWVNSDDVLLPGALEALARTCRDNPSAGFVAGGAVLVDEDGRVLRGRLGLPRIYASSGWVPFERLAYRGAAFLQPGTLWRREDFVALGGLEESLRFCFDMDLFYRLARLRPGVAARGLVAAYRMHSESKTSTLQRVREEEMVLLDRRHGIERGGWKARWRRMRAAAGNRVDRCVNWWNCAGRDFGSVEGVAGRRGNE